MYCLWLQIVEIVKEILIIIYSTWIIFIIVQYTALK